MNSFKTPLGHFSNADCLPVLRALPENSIDLVITSPPYDSQPKYNINEAYDTSWYKGFFLEVTAEIYRTLKPTGSFVLNYRSKRRKNERGTLQYELVFWLREQGFLFCEDFIWGKPSPPPGRFNRFLKDAVEYCFHFAKGPDWQFFPGECLLPSKESVAKREKRKEPGYPRENSPAGHGKNLEKAHPDLVRPSTLLYLHPEFDNFNPSRHPARFPVTIPEFFIKLLTRPGQLVVDPFGGTGTTGVAAERLGRTWLLVEIDEEYFSHVPSRFAREGILPVPYTEPDSETRGVVPGEKV